MTSTKTMIYKSYAITEQIINADYGSNSVRVFRYTVERPNNGGKIGNQTTTLAAAHKLVNDDLAQSL